MKIISWNIAHRSQLWWKLLDADADIALLQEACEPPSELAVRFDIDDAPWRTAGAGLKRHWRTVVVGLNPRIRLHRVATLPLAEAGPGDFAVSRPGTLAVAEAENLDTGERVTVISMYAPWDRTHASTNSRWIFADASVHRLISDISVLIGSQNGHRIVAAGDLNILYGYGENASSYWAERYRVIFERFSAVGLEFVGPQYPFGRQADPWPEELPLASLNVPTFYTSRQSPATATRQLDFVFASVCIAGRVKTMALNKVEEWGDSDHCKIDIEL